MADSGSSNTGVVAVLVIFVIVAGAAFFAWQGGMFGGGGSKGDSNVDVNIETPTSEPAKPDNG